MTRNYDRHLDKENSYDLDSAIYNKTKPTTNIQLRKKLQQNLALYQRQQPNIIEEEVQTSRRPSDSSPLNVSNKRENARRRGFDLKISNIDTINEKITGLLNMVKKDKQGDKKETLRQQREDNEGDRSTSYSITNRFKRYNNSNQADKKGPREDVPISRFNEASFPDKRREIYQGETQRQQHSRKDREEYNNRELEEPRRYRMQQQEDKRRDTSSNSKVGNQPRQRKTEDTKIWWDKLLEEDDWQKHSLTKGMKPNYDIQKAEVGSQQKKAIDIMIEERRKQRYQYRQVEQEEEKFAQRARSAIKVKNEQKMRAVNQSHKASPITKVNNDQSFEDTFSNIRTPLSRNQSRDQRFSRFAEISYIEEDLGKQEKINCTAKLIDEQLMRIKSKINDSEANKRRLDSMQPKSQQSFKGKEHVIRIADSISSQVKLDNHLKQAREAFDRLAGESKWDELQKIAGQKGLKIDSRTLKELVTIAPDEHNPFGGERSSTNIQDLVELLSTAQKNWQNCVLKCSSCRNLKNEGFNVSDLDLNNKGYLGPEDLVCFVNLYANTFYRNRDLALVTRRLQMLQGPSGNSGIEYETFLEAFAV